MRHKKHKYKLNRYSSWRKSTVNGLARNLLIYQRITTTLVRAKAAKPVAEKLISLAKVNTLAAKRDAAKILNDHKLVSLLFRDIGPRFTDRVGGYTRIINLGQRRGDDARLVIFELTEIKEKKVSKPKKEIEVKPEVVSEGKPASETKAEAPRVAPKEKEKFPVEKKPPKKFLGGIRGIFKKERDAL